MLGWPQGRSGSRQVLAQIELQEAVPFAVTTRPVSLLSPEQQAEAWTDALGAY
jgi:hypothetical protein